MRGDDDGRKANFPFTREEDFNQGDCLSAGRVMGMRDSFSLIPIHRQGLV